MLVLRPNMRGIPETMVCGILMFMRSFGPLFFAALGSLTLAFEAPRSGVPWLCDRTLGATTMLPVAWRVLPEASHKDWRPRNSGECW